MIIAAHGFCFFLPKQKEGPRQGLAESSFFIVPMVIEKIKLTLRQTIQNTSM
jgi:hypothetical protein